MEKNFGSPDWRNYVPKPIYSEKPEYEELYYKAWELAYEHIKEIPGMPQNPYMDEAFCATQVWIWDSCFMALFCKYAPDVFPGVETLNNFYEVLYNQKALAEIVVPEGEPKWTGYTPGQMTNIKVHIADNPPLFAFAEYENALMSGDAAYLKKLLYEDRFLQKHYEWVEGLKEQKTIPNVSVPTCLINENIGYRWEGGCSGMDNTPRGRTGPKAEKERPNNPDLLWVDAICQQALCARTISRLFTLIKDEEQAKVWDDIYKTKKNLINELYWCEEDGFYYDIDYKTRDFNKVMTPASFWALTAGVADSEQALKMAKQIENPDTLGGKVPLVSLARNDADYIPSGGYWRGGMWLPTAYASLRGLSEYQIYDVAHEAGCKIIKHMYDTYKEYEPHTIWECYAPEKCMPCTQTDSKNIVRPDFCGWSALGPISIYIEYVLGFHTINGFERKVYWEKPKTNSEEIGIRNLRFADVVTDIVANGDICKVKSNNAYTLIINGKSYTICEGEQEFKI